MKILFSLSALFLAQQAAADTGMLRAYSPQKRIGYIRPDDGGRDVFFRLNNDLYTANLEFHLERGTCLSYEMLNLAGRWEAIQLKVIACQ